MVLEEGVAAANSAPSVLFQPHMLALVATAQAADRLLADARRSVATAIDVSEQTGERSCLPELYRLRGELRLSSDSLADERALAGSDFHTAIRLAEQSGAGLLAVRVRRSLWLAQG